MSGYKSKDEIEHAAIVAIGKILRSASKTDSELWPSMAISQVAGILTVVEALTEMEENER